MKKLFRQEEFTEQVKSFMFLQISKEKRRIGVREFANQVGISPSTFSRIENGKVPDLETFFKFCNWMGLSPYNFMN